MHIQYVYVSRYLSCDVCLYTVAVYGGGEQSEVDDLTMPYV